MALAVENGALIAKSGSLGTGAECCCGPQPTPPCVGACCVSGVCTAYTQAACADLGGTWFGCGTECSESLCGPQEDCVDDCCPDVPGEISLTIVVDPVDSCFIASIGPFGTIIIQAVIEEFSLSETITIPLTSLNPCPSYFINNVIDGVRYTIQVDLSVNESGICVWHISGFLISKCSQANTEGDYQGPCPSLYKYGNGLDAGGAFPDLGVTGCVGGTVVSTPVPTGFDSNVLCDPADDRICEGTALDCDIVETTVTVTISV